MQTVTLARHAMATRFELVLHGEHAAGLRAAGEEALNEIDRIEAQLSLYRPDTEIARLNARAAHESVRVSPELFALLTHAKQLSDETDGAFDITIGPLLRCWGLMGRSRRTPSAAAPDPGGDDRSRTGGERPDDARLAEARARVGMDLVQLNAVDRTVRFARDGVVLDLGAIGKGYAVDKAVEMLREAGVNSALIHGGTSTVYAIGSPPDAECWSVSVATLPPDPPDRRSARSVGSSDHSPETVPGWPAFLPLRDSALSVSAGWGKTIRVEGEEMGHVINPRTGQPVQGAALAVVVLPSATETDALSTALLVAGADGHEKIHRLRAGMKTLLIVRAPDGFRTQIL